MNKYRKTEVLIILYYINREEIADFDIGLTPVGIDTFQTTQWKFDVSSLTLLCYMENPHYELNYLPCVHLILFISIIFTKVLGAAVQIYSILVKKWCVKIGMPFILEVNKLGLQ